MWISGARRRRSVQLAAQPADDQLDDVGAAAEAVLPHVVEDLRLGQHGRRLAHQIAQHLVLGRGQRRAACSPRRTSRVSSSIVRSADLEHGPLEGGAGAAPQHGPQPGHQLLHRERLDQVVVAAPGQPRDPVGDAVARGEEHHRHHRARTAQPVQHAEAVHAGQHQVEHHDVGTELGGPAQRVLAGVRGDRVPALVAGDGRDEVGDGRVVVHDEESHFFHPLIVLHRSRAP